jgi:hypothetical protein
MKKKKMKNGKTRPTLAVGVRAALKTYASPTSLAAKGETLKLLGLWRWPAEIPNDARHPIEDTLTGGCMIM